MKKLLPILCVFVLVAVLLPFLLHTASADETSGKCGDTLYWSFNESTGTLTITGFGEMWHRCSWANYRKLIKEVVASTDLKSIGNYAFGGCSELVSFSIPNSVVSIGENAFRSCTALKAIHIPGNVLSIGMSAFQNCTLLSLITLEDGIKHLGNSVFSGCTDLTSIIIPDSVLDIGSYAFDGCTSLKSITIGNLVSRIGDWAFSRCAELENIYYHGTKNMAWFSLSIGDNNPCLKNAIWHYLVANAIEIKTLPNKLEYAYGESLETNGGCITTYYDYNIVEQEWITSEMVTGFDNIRVGRQDLTVTFDGNTTSYQVIVLPKSGWNMIDNRWYYYENGDVKTGWLYDAGKWYYLEPGGEYQGSTFTDGWRKVEGRWYFFNPGGHIARNTWKEIPDKSGTWYYFSAGGQMVTGWQKLGNSWYLFNPGGTLVTGWRKTGQYWYYLGTGAMRTGWQQLSGKWYYFRTANENPEGAMVTGDQTINGTLYHFDDNGVWIS